MPAGLQSTLTQTYVLLSLSSFLIGIVSDAPQFYNAVPVDWVR